MAMETTDWAVGQILNAALGHQMSTAMWEGFCAGNTHWPVRGVAVAALPRWNCFAARLPKEKPCWSPANILSTCTGA